MLLLLLVLWRHAAARVALPRAHSGVGRRRHRHPRVATSPPAGSAASAGSAGSAPSAACGHARTGSAAAVDVDRRRLERRPPPAPNEALLLQLHGRGRDVLLVQSLRQRHALLLRRWGDLLLPVAPAHAPAHAPDPVRGRGVKLEMREHAVHCGELHTAETKPACLDAGVLVVHVSTAAEDGAQAEHAVVLVADAKAVRARVRVTRHLGPRVEAQRERRGGEVAGVEGTAGAVRNKMRLGSTGRVFEAKALEIWLDGHGSQPECITHAQLNIIHANLTQC